MKLFKLLSFLVLFFSSSYSFAEIWDLPTEDFEKLPVLDEGRVKPMEAYSRSKLLGFSSREYLKVGDKKVSASKWMLELILDHKLAYQRDLFYIPNPALIKHLGMNAKKSHRYSFFEVSAVLKSKVQEIQTIASKEDEDISLVESQLAVLYSKSTDYFEISQSFALFLPQFYIEDENLKNKLGLNLEEEFFSYLTLSKSKNLEVFLKEDLKDIDIENIDPNKKINLVLAGKFLSFPRYGSNSSFRIIKVGEDWVSPWEAFKFGQSDLSIPKIFDSIEAITNSYFTGGNNEKYNEKLSLNLLKLSDEVENKYDENEVFLLNLENRYVKANLPKYATTSFVISFFFLCIFALYSKSWLTKGAYAFVVCGFLCQLTALIMRIIILGRPPVGTLYESILFVSLTSVFFCLIFNKYREDASFLMVASIIGTVLGFVASRYSLDGDTMGVLVAVLNSNFWLSTHVLTITIGYGACVVGGVLAHIYLIKKAFSKGNQDSLYKAIVGIALFSLFFTMFGTILGGIWADQSWGRFWGWDPKENGALLIVLWLLWILHGRVIGQFNKDTFVVLMVITNITVALAWFGVNLLGVGLHSYGFTDGAAYRLLAFCLFETIFAMAFYLQLKFRKLA